MTQPMVSIVIPVRNRPAMVREAIESALAQSYDNYEIVVSDNASSDSTWATVCDLAEKCPRIRALRNKRNLGVFGNTRRAILASRADLIKVLWSDDLLERNAVARYVEALSPEAAFSFSAAVIRFADREVVAYQRDGHGEIIGRDAFVEAMVSGRRPLPVSPGCALLRKEYALWALEMPYRMKTLASYAPRIGPDLLMLLAAFVDYKAAVWLDEPLAIFRAHEGSITIAERGPGLTVGYLGAVAEFLHLAELSPAAAASMRQSILLATGVRPRVVARWLKVCGVRTTWQIVRDLLGGE